MSLSGKIATRSVIKSIALWIVVPSIIAGASLSLMTNGGVHKQSSNSTMTTLDARYDNENTDRQHIMQLIAQHQSNMEAWRRQGTPPSDSDRFVDNAVDGVIANALGFVGLTPIEQDSVATEMLYNLLMKRYTDDNGIGVYAKYSARVIGFSKDSAIAYVTLAVVPQKENRDLASKIEVVATNRVMDAYGVTTASNTTKPISGFPIAIETKVLLRILVDEVSHENKIRSGINAGQSAFESAVKLQGR